VSTVEYEIGPRSIPAGQTTPDAPALQSMLAKMVEAGCRSAVMEVSSHALVQKRTAGIDYDVAVFTNLTHDHLDYHRTMEEYFEAKALLFRGLGMADKDATAVINVDDPWGQRLLALSDVTATMLSYGVDADADVTATDVALTPEGSRFRVRTPWGEAALALRLLGRFNVSNALAALAACGSLGVPLDRIVPVLSEIALVRGRLEEVDTGKGFQVFVDYAHTDDALEHVLKTLREITRGRLIVVFGCGGNRDKTKRAAMGRAASRFADHSIITSDNPRNEEPAAIISDIRQGFNGSAECGVIEDRRQAIAWALHLAREGDVVLVAGKGHEAFQEFANKTVPFDDRQVVREMVDG
jgi:UDP-N-acetylmuramoyl-L-alanyl-D-glutamate--2,6-diaminopimelate ligase